MPTRSRVTKCQHETQSSMQECRVGVYAMLSNVLYTDTLYAISMNKDSRLKTLGSLGLWEHDFK